MNTDTQTLVPTLQTIREARERIGPFIHRTPVLTSSSLDALAGARVFFKCENFQKIGAFKIRGGMNAVLSLPVEGLRNGVATHSSGNHAQAIAYAAREVGTKAYIVMPRTAPEIKKKAVAGYGAEIILCEPTLQAREDTLREVVARTGAAFVHPFDDYRVIAGQATCAAELLEDVPGLEVVMAPVGGGGLLGGTALAVHYLSPGTRVIAGEPAGADDAYRSLKAGAIQANATTQTIADGLLTSLGDKTFPLIQQYVEDIITVTDEEIVAAMRLIWERMKIIIEPSCAVPFAALLKEKERFAGKKVGIILTGGNVDLGKLPF
ncbi:MAG: Serine racemase @ L-serine dehydratase, (PLP)-dependent @ D-serine ammonia-lyase [uncultured Cytophagales bacterium]|uniref:Serine racemase @ L-serine dehydratase, (PLP)-dependent @ D-serine ammonia-lyase n=1 Tax=uncultured Cytophagales bacterium TaxID=158755 RepID=A0A6J4H925_9SPHI|nr:MAG: Serine racemase @ L-serine dehydratase, (PLP)-dependent @ D-serine ammonia-lyase [uncultured Cytophagales bacterium]